MAPFVGVYDSGFGGLSVLKAIYERLPNERLLYFADSAYAPYGDRPEKWVEQRVEDVVAMMVAQGAKAIVLACNTATAIAVDNLRRRYSLPIIAIEPGVKVAIEKTLSGVVGVIATTGTLGSKRYQQLLDRVKGSVQVVSCATPGLVEYIEANDLESDSLHALLSEYIQPMRQQGIDQLVLGCTHYPFIEQQILRVVGAQVALVNPAEAVANHLHQKLKTGELLAVDNISTLMPAVHSTQHIQMMTTGSVHLAQRFIQQTIGWLLVPEFFEVPETLLV